MTRILKISLPRILRLAPLGTLLLASCGGKTDLLELHDTLPDAGLADAQTDAPVDGTPDALGPEAYVQVTGAYRHACALVNSGRVVCWGANESGQLGDKTLKDHAHPVDVVGINDARLIRAAYGRTCAVHADHRISCWGSLPSGVEESENVPVPRQVADLPAALDVAVGDKHSCALSTLGEVWCWGFGRYGQLGNGGSEFSPTPVRAAGMYEATAVAAGRGFSCALRKGGSVYCWGSNDTYQAGGPTEEPLLAPTAVEGTDGATQLSVRTSHGCVVTPDFDVRCWGSNHEEKLGFSTTWCCSPAAQQVENVENVLEVSVGDVHTCVRHTDGKVTCWGLNLSGQVGDGTTSKRSPPVAVVGLADTTTLGIGHHHSCVIDSSARVRCWGDNRDGEMGGAVTPNQQLTPITVLEAL